MSRWPPRCGIHLRVVGVAAQLDQQLAGAESDVREGPRVEAGVAAVREQDDHRAAALEGEQAVGAVPPFGVVAPAVRVARRKQAGGDAAPADAERVAAAGLGEVAVVAELLAVEVDDRVARHHQRVRLRDVLEGERLEDVVVVRELDARRAVVQPSSERSRAASLMRCQAPAVPVCSRLSFSAKYSLKSSVSRLPPMRPGSAGLIVFLTCGSRMRGIRVEHLAVGEDVILAAVEEAARVLPVDGAVEEVEHEPLDVLGGIDAQPVNADDLHEPLRVSHQVRRRVLDRRVAGHRVVEVERVDGDVLLVRASDRTRRSSCGRCRDRTGDSADRHVGEPPEAPAWFLPAGCSRSPGSTGLRMKRWFFSCAMSMSPASRSCSSPPAKAEWKSPSTSLGSVSAKPGIPAGILEARRSQVREAVVIDDEVDVQAEAGPVQHPAERLQALLGAVQRRLARPAQIEAVVHVVADAETRPGRRGTAAAARRIRIPP